MSKEMVIVVGHGSRVKKSNDDFESLVQTFSQRCPEKEFKIGYVELADPRFKDVLSEAVTQTKDIVVLPLFLLTAGHIKHDVRDLVNKISEQHPEANIRIASALGVHANMAELVANRLSNVFAVSKSEPQKTAVLMIGRGSSDVDANSDFCKIVRLVEEQVPYARMAYSFMAITTPKVEEVLIRLLKEGHSTILMSPYLLFDGQLLERMQVLAAQYNDKHDDIEIYVTKTMGADNLVLDLFEKRLKEV